MLPYSLPWRAGSSGAPVAAAWLSPPAPLAPLGHCLACRSLAQSWLRVFPSQGSSPASAPTPNNSIRRDISSSEKSVTQRGVWTCPNWVQFLTWDERWVCNSLFSLTYLHKGLYSKNRNLSLKVWNTSRTILHSSTLGPVSSLFHFARLKLCKQKNNYLPKVKSYANVFEPNTD